MKDIDDDIFISDLIVRYMHNDCSSDDLVMLKLWLRDKGNQETFRQLLDQDNVFEDLLEMASIDTNKSYAKFYARVNSRKLVRVSVMFAAAVSALLMGLLVIYNYQFRSHDTPQVAYTAAPANLDQAMMMTTAGEVVYINDTVSEINLQKHVGATDEVLNTPQLQSVSQPEMLNLLSTVNKSSLDIVLYDGTKVKLNSHSTLKYPDSFDSDNRTVILNGEAFFEVAKDSRRPFIVKTSVAKIRVLGTVFNVLASANSCKTTLIEGSVRLSNNNKDSVVLRPGEQGFVSATSPIQISYTNSIYDIAWTRNAFGFYDKALETILNEICAWYDLTLVIENVETARMRYTTILDKDLNIDRIMDILQMVNDFDYTLDNKILTIK